MTEAAVQLGMAIMPEPDVVPAQKREGRVLGVYVTSDRSSEGFQTGALSSLTLALDGIVGSRHQGWTMPADARVPYLPRGTTMRGTRAVSLVSREDMAEAAQRLGIAELDPRWIGANVIVEGIERFSFLPRGTRLFCEGGVILSIEAQNAPCRFAGAAISGHTDRPSIELDFPKVAKRLRGVVASVEHPGTIAPGCPINARIPEQWLYR